jgi:hypothetical protein
MRRRREDGTSTLEIMGMAPLVVLLLLILVQAAMALYGITTAQTAARQGARAYSQGDDPVAVVRSSVPKWMDVETEKFGPGHGVRATLDLPDIVPFYDLKVSRKTVMP